MLIYAVDLGTTNTKVALYDDRLRNLAVASAPVDYSGSSPITEFDPDVLFARMVELMWSCAETASTPTSREPASIVLTGQAESLVLVGASGEPLSPGISWLDARSTAEATEMMEHFGGDRAFEVTGQPLATSTWPATKLRWLLRHNPDLLARATHILMLKDFIQLRLTGQVAGELSTRAFTYLFDVRKADYWSEMVDFCGVRRDQLPELVRPGTDLGPVLAAVAATLPPAASWVVNVGALDHFSSMVGTESYSVGRVAESAGTVLSLSILLDQWDFDPTMRASYHRGVRGDEFVLFDCCDSGAICLEWFANTMGMPLDTLDVQLAARSAKRVDPLFLPQITGVNPPEFLADAHGAFVDITLGTNSVDLAYAVIEGVAHLLRANVEYCERVVGSITHIVSTGGGAASSFWTQLKADVCDVDITVPGLQEATCRGAAVLGLVSAGLLGDLSDAAQLAPLDSDSFYARHTTKHDQRYARYQAALRNLYG